MEFTTLSAQIRDLQGTMGIRIDGADADRQVAVLKKILMLFRDVPDCRVQGRITYQQASSPDDVPRDARGIR